MEFKRILTPEEIEKLGDNPKSRIHQIINDAFKHMGKADNLENIIGRFMSLMSSEKPMTARELMEAHNAVYGNIPVGISYTRFIISGMYSAELIKRVSRGKYVKH